MAILTTAELAAMRQAVAVGEHPSWSKQTLNAALQGVEDVLESLALDASTLVAVSTVTDARSQTVKDDLDGSRISVNIRPVVEDWLLEHPPSVTTRKIDTAAISSYITANRRVFGAVLAMPTNQRAKVIRLVIERRVRTVL